MKRRRRLWRPTLRPIAGRKIPRELRPENVGLLAGTLPGGLRNHGFPVLLRRIDQAPVLEGNRVEVFCRGADAFAAARQAIEEAKSEVLVES